MSSPSVKEAWDALSHEDLMEATESSLRRLLASDPLLKDLPVDVTLEEVNAQIAVATGQAITVRLLRDADDDDEPLQVVIPQQGTTVLDLKKAIQRSFHLHQQRSSHKQHRAKISWRYVWKAYHLTHDDHRLRDNNEFVSNYGVRNKSSLAFVKRLRKR